MWLIRLYLQIISFQNLILMPPAALSHQSTSEVEPYKVFILYWSGDHSWENVEKLIHNISLICPADGWCRHKNMGLLGSDTQCKHIMKSWNNWFVIVWNKVICQTPKLYEGKYTGKQKGMIGQKRIYPMMVWSCFMCLYCCVCIVRIV